MNWNTDKIIDRISLANYIGQMRKDLEINSKNWGNLTLDIFLEAMESYTENIQGYYDNQEKGQNADIPSWKVFADILRGATIYE